MVAAMALLAQAAFGVDATNWMPSNNIKVAFMPAAPQVNSTFQALVSAKYNNNESVLYGFVSFVSANGTCYCTTCRITSYVDSICDCVAGPNVGTCNVTFNVLGEYYIENQTSVQVNVSPYVSLTGIDFWPQQPTYNVVGGKVTAWVEVNNSKLTTRKLGISVGETDRYDRFDLTYNTSFWPRPHNISSFPVDVVVHDMVKPGTYRITVSVTSERTTSENINIVVPDTANVTENVVNVFRYIDINDGAGQSDVTLRLNNRMPGEVIFDLRETIPKSVASSLTQVDFTDFYTTLVESDPIVMWRVTLQQGQVRDITYTASTSLEGRLGEIGAPELIMLSAPNIPATPDQPGTPATPGGQPQSGQQPGPGPLDFLSQIDPLYILIPVIIVAAFLFLMGFKKRKKEETEVWPTRALESYRDEIENW